VEHGVLHLLYARFWHKVLYDLGLVSTKEPFQRLFNQGMVHATSYNDSPDGRGRFYLPQEVEQRDGGFVVKATGQPVHTKVMKMSKSRYNVTNPDDVCRDQGADALRLYELFMGPLQDGALWEDAGVAGTRRFLDKAWRLVVELPRDESVADRGLDRALHSAIKKVTEAVSTLRFNTAISEMMIFVNEALKLGRARTDQLEAFVRILSPFAPHIGEELWERLGHSETISRAEWPAFDEAKLALDTIAIAVQVNGKLRGQIEVPVDADKAAILAAAKAEPGVAKHLEGTTIKREVYVPGRLVNLVVG
jgi:leucyl-tRNA synthetase